MIEEILELRSKGLSFRKIAVQLNTTVGKVQYSWVKYQKSRKEKEEKEEMAIPAMPKKKTVRKGKWKARIHKIRAPRCDLHLTFSKYNRLFCYWTIDSSIIRSMLNYHQTSTDDARAVLRIFNVSGIPHFNGSNAHSYQDIMVKTESTDWYLNELQEGRSYCIEYGFLLPNDHFLPLVRSNTITIPCIDNQKQGLVGKEILDEFSKKAQTTPKWIEHVSTYTYYEKPSIEKEKR
ncbi:DUF4912 domain-containing protein [Falsibacillus albus]|nr:DUF4912 domain-containing protein [Falsibacillus albus]